MDGTTKHENVSLNASAQDSIVALEALLEINNSVASSSAGIKKEASNYAPSNIDESRNGSFVPNPLSCSSSIPSMINQPATTELNRLNTSLQQSSLGPNIIGPSPPIFPFLYSSSPQIPALTLPNASVQASIKSNLYILSPKDKSNASNQETMSSNTVNTSLRTEEIEAALRSKPQRGRRRDNLSVEERQELTRTRNRAHARSTRNRKKARYEELIEKEKKYDNLLLSSNISNERRTCVLEFMKLRSNTDGGGVALELTHPLHEKLLDLINADKFEYFTLPPSIISTDNNKTKTGLEMLKYHDECLIESVIPKFTNEKRIVLYEFKVKDEESGIAITSDTCYTMYDVVISNSNHEKNDETIRTILSGLVNINFQSKSVKINSIKESLLNPSMAASVFTSSKMNVPKKQNENNSIHNAYPQSFPNVISWNNICNEQQSATTSSSSTSNTHVPNEFIERSVNDTHHNVMKDSSPRENDKPNKRVKIQVNDEKSHLKKNDDTNSNKNVKRIN